MKHLSRSPIVWISATALSAMLYFFAFHFFPQTFPIVNLAITMDLDQALEQAGSIAKQYSIGPVDYRNAAMFHTDSNTQTFVELEAGGKDAFIAMMENKLYEPYTWQVRHFKEHEKHECKIIFTADGKPYGFIETISENAAGKQLTEKDARAIAERDAVTYWNVDLSHYKLVEASQTTAISQRVDHTFVYERTDAKIGEGLYRLKIVVSGDKTTQLIRFVKVPESFTRRYAEMRSANTTISVAAAMIMQLLYIIIGCGLGLYWLIRRRLYIIRQSVMWAVILAAATTIASINQLPFWWMSYSNAYSINGFLIQTLIMFLMMFLTQTIFLSIVIITAEGLTRSAFGNHPQLWSVWSSENSASYAVLGRTLGGYLFVGFSCAFVIGFYLFSLKYLGWWSPAEMLFNPNILATYVPWFSPLALSLNAGFMEECLFRAIPLAGAALLGNYFGRRNLFIGIAFVLQAVVFGAAHATYPVQPAYARLVELLIPSLIWGATYLAFGLLPTIIAHFTYDVIWFSIPIFISQSPEAFSYKIIIITATLLPLLRTVTQLLKRGRLHDLPESARNAAWQPIPKTEPTYVDDETTEVVAPTTHYTKTITILGLLGLIAWVSTTRFTHDGITFALNRNQAIERANNFLQEKNIVLNAPWKTLPLVLTDYKSFPHIAMQHKFIWKKGKKDLYQKLLGTYLQPAHWTIRYAQFDTDLIQRTEEHKVLLYDNTILRYTHKLPESTAGAALSQDQARVIAHSAIKEQFNIEPAQLLEISATQTQLPNRMDWLFIFSDSSAYPLPTGQARISVAIAGDTVVDATRTIHVPEEWERKELHKQNILNIVRMIFMLVSILFLVLAVFVTLRRRRNFTFSQRLFYLFTAIAGILYTLGTINNWQNIIGQFNTSLPLVNQLFQTLAGFGIQTLISSCVYGLVMSYILSYRTKNETNSTSTQSAIVGISSGLLIAGIISFAQTLIPVNMPLWPNYLSLIGTFQPLTSLLITVALYFNATITCCLLFIMTDVATISWQKKRILFTIIAAICGLSLFDLPSIKMLPIWLIVGIAIGSALLAVYRYIMRYDYSLIPLATASYIMVKIIQQGTFNAYQGAWYVAVINMCATGTIAILWHRYVRDKRV